MADPGTPVVEDGAPVTTDPALSPLALDRRTLLVYVPRTHASRAQLAGADPGPGVRALVHRIRRALDAEAGAGGVPWDLRVVDHRAGWWSRGSAHARARELGSVIASWVEAAAQDGTPYEQIVLVGHSLGGILVRDAWVSARDDLAAPGGDALSEWSLLVRRIVLLAAPNAGFRVGGLPWRARLLYLLASPWTDFLVEDLRRGSGYIVDLRLRWVRRFRQGAPGGQAEPPLPGVVQLIGSKDRLVSTEDSIDVSYMPGSVVLRVPLATHAGLAETCATRAAFPVVWHALVGGFSAADAAPATPSPDPALMILHGIRSGKYDAWISELSRLVRAAGMEVHTPSYGYVSALGFAIPFRRWQQAREFRDWYGRVYVRHRPEAISFAGHSFGTYALGDSLLHVPAMTFNRVYLAGSVLPREFPWQVVIDERDQILGQVCSERATRDVPVGILCSFLRGLGMSGLGTGGVNGFDAESGRLLQRPGWVAGGHSDALGNEAILAWVADFLAKGVVGPDPDKTDAPADSGFQRAGRLAARAGTVVLVLGVGAVLAGLLRAAGVPLAWPQLPALGWAGLVVLAVIGLFLWTY